MAASPFSFSADRFWTEEKEKTLIGFFSKHSCLWNHRSESYKSRKLRWRTLEQLRVILSTLPPPNPFTVEDIKNKFKNLRTTFRRQYKLVRASQVCRLEHVFEPQWKHYEQLMFLQGCWETDPRVEEQPLQTLPQEEAQSVGSSPGLITSSLPNAPTSFPSTSSNMQLKCYWTEETERALITFYCEHSCLWNKKSENHNNRQIRLRLLETLRAQLSDRSVSFAVEDIKNKFKNLRTVFNREFKAVRASRASDRLFVSKWKHYQQLLFLCECCDEDEGPDDLQDDKEAEPGNQTPSSTRSSFSSSSTHTSSIMVGNASAPTSTAQSNSRTNSSAGSQILLLASPDNLRPSNQTAALPTSPSASPTDTKPCASSPPLSFSVSVPVESDGRPDPRCHWSEAKVQQLISFYSERSCLWNHRSESYRNRLLRQSLLETLSGLMSHDESVPFTVDDIKAKFRNLRTIFQREHRAVSSNKTCGSEDFYVPKWKHYRDLMFLCDSCDEDEKPEDVHVPQPQESGPLQRDNQATPPTLLYHAASQTDAKLNAMPQGFEAPPSPTPPDSRHSSPSSSPPPSTSSSHTSSRASGRKRAAPTTGILLDLMRTFCQSQAVSPHAGFLKYVEECLNETPPDQVKKLKKKIIETIHGASEEV
ncbi:uncharacterized protein LOC128424487 [Pleuronectes platessa]|uniref:uncharacterized protein LOC128424487 n=1 Tax=Pleuronectes platessa TaxID=8262 RepID=UPI00232A2A8F|nr:uncharacterized protein LOC128424487 [Pleuronectes platessa]